NLKQELNRKHMFLVNFNIFITMLQREKIRILRFHRVFTNLSKNISILEMMISLSNITCGSKTTNIECPTLCCFNNHHIRFQKYVFDIKCYDWCSMAFNVNPK